MLIMLWKINMIFCKHAMIIMSKCDLCATVKLIIGVSECEIKIQHI